MGANYQLAPSGSPFLRIDDPQEDLRRTQQATMGRQANYQYGTGFGPSQASQDAQALARIPEDYRQQRFNTLLPYFTGSLGQGPDTIGGQNSKAPEISVGGVLNPQQVQQQVNQSRAGNDQQTQTNIRNSSQDLMGRGFGANSPLAQSLAQGYQNQNLAANTQNETNTRLAAAQQNAGQVLNTQQARSNQWATGEQLGIERQKPYWQRQNALLAALASLA